MNRSGYLKLLCRTYAYGYTVIYIYIYIKIDKNKPTNCTCLLKHIKAPLECVSYIRFLVSPTCFGPPFGPSSGRE